MVNHGKYLFVSFLSRYFGMSKFHLYLVTGSNELGGSDWRKKNMGGEYKTNKTKIEGNQHPKNK